MKNKDAFGDIGKRRMGMKGLELNGGYSFVKKSSRKKEPKSRNNKGKIWSW